MCAQLFSCVQLFVIPWTVACQAHRSVEFSRREYWSGLLFPTWGDLLTQGSNLCLLCLLFCQEDSLPLSHVGNHNALILCQFKEGYFRCFCIASTTTCPHRQSPTLQVDSLPAEPQRKAHFRCFCIACVCRCLSPHPL